MQVCIDCGQEFTPPAHTGLPPQRCTDCRALRKKATDAAKAKRWREANPEQYVAARIRSREKRKLDPDHQRRRNERLLFTKYGLTMADFNALLESQGGVCAICKGDRNGPGARFHVDHHHTSGRVRGLLCGRCNTAIGLLQDSPELAEAAAVYLRR